MAGSLGRPMKLGSGHASLRPLSNFVVYQFDLLTACALLQLLLKSLAVSDEAAALTALE